MPAHNCTYTPGPNREVVDVEVPTLSSALLVGVTATVRLEEEAVSRPALLRRVRAHLIHAHMGAHERREVELKLEATDAQKGMHFERMTWIGAGIVTSEVFAVEPREAADIALPPRDAITEQDGPARCGRCCEYVAWRLTANVGWFDHDSPRLRYASIDGRRDVYLAVFRQSVHAVFGMTHHECDLKAERGIAGQPQIIA